MEIVFLGIGLLVGFLAAWFIARYKYSASSDSPSDKNILEEVRADNKVLEEKAAFITQEYEKLQDELKIKEKEVVNLNTSLAEKNTEFNVLKKKLEEQKEDVKKLQEQFTVQFKNLANDILDEKTKKFTEQNKSNIHELLKPLGEKIKDFEKRVEETYDKESKQRFSLKEEVKRLAELNQQISKEASNLTNALKGSSKTQGNWGEVVLENILERSGLVKDREYFVQSSYTTEDGKRLQPDVIVAYPGERNVVIDSKVSLIAYEKFVNAESEEEKEAALKEHLISVKNHINDLASKNYQDLYELKTLDFVMLFMPIEPAYLIAVQNDSNLWHFAYEKRILLISPTNLIAALKMVASLWQQEYQSRNVMEIAKQSGALYDKFEGLVQDLIDVGRRLDSAQTAYKSSMNKLTEGKGNLISRVENIKKLGAKTKKSLPQSLIDRSIENE